MIIRIQSIYINSSYFSYRKQGNIIISFYTVQGLIGKRIRKGTIEYKVKWKGYSEDDCTWEPLKNLQYVQDLVKQYDENEKMLSQPPTKKMEKETRFKNDQIYDQENQDEEYPREQNQNQGYDNYSPQKRENEYEETAQQFNDRPQEVFEEDQDQKEDYDIEMESSQFRDENFDSEKDKIKQPPPRKVQKTEQKTSKPIQAQKSNHKTTNKLKKNQEYQTKQQPKKSYLQEIEEKTRFVTKSAPKKISTTPPQISKFGQLKVLNVSKCSHTNQFIYLTQLGPLSSYRSRETMRTLYPDELIKFYENRIQFAKIPKLSK